MSRRLDGKHINLLETALFMFHLPQLVKEGKIYVAVSPFYIIKENNKRIYLYDDKELNAYIKKHGAPSFINRIKGIGELSPEELWDTTMNPANRRLIQLTTKDFDKSAALLKQLMGKISQDRKDFINSYEEPEEEEL